MTIDDMVPLATDGTVEGCIEAHSVMLEVFADTAIETVREKMEELGYVFDEKYGGVPLGRDREKPTTIYRVFIPDCLKDGAWDRLSELDFTYHVWGDAKIAPMGPPS